MLHHKRSSLTRAALIILSLCFANRLAASAPPELYGVEFLSGPVEVFIVDPGTGVLTPLMPLPSAQGIVGGISTFDPVGKRLFFMSDGSTLNVVNVASHTVSQVNLGGNYPLLQFDATSNTLYGVYFLSGLVEVFIVDPGTSVLTPLMPLPTAQGIVGGISTFDPVGKRLFFMSDGSTLNVVNVASHTVSQVNLGGNYPLLQFDATSNTLYGVYFLSGLVEVFIVDPGTGVLTPLMPLPTAQGIVGGISTFDPIGKRLFFMSDGSTLNVVNVASHTVSQVNLNGKYPLLQFDSVAASIDVLQPWVAVALVCLLAFIGARLTKL